MEGQVKMLFALFLTLCACMVGWGAGYILKKLTKYGHICRRNLHLNDAKSILLQILGRVRSEKGYACLRIVVITLVTFMLAGAFQSRLDPQTYVLLFCAAVIIVLLSYDLRLSFIYGLMSSSVGVWLLLRGRFRKEDILQTTLTMFKIPDEQALTIIVGCAIISTVVVSFSLLYRTWYKGSSQDLGGEAKSIGAEEDRAQEEFLCRACTIAAYAGIPISCLVSGIFAKIL